METTRWTISHPSASSEATDRYIASGVGGAILGASTGFGPPGAIVGAIIGIGVALSVNTQIKKREEKQEGHTQPDY